MESPANSQEQSSPTCACHATILALAEISQLFDMHPSPHRKLWSVSYLHGVVLYKYKFYLRYDNIVNILFKCTL